ncbi:DeoR/GlpR family DNA-binding transcription regulator [Biostraticola tofi]|uniref:DeoR family transcriptional regulator n=1 Tax=Biostraticola tofi TaxID=466109 RepID=A0A4R3YVS2_9GAMM|nr:DeoR/GlpR family DNA-binding transcription regulator [Biostraticola tofi]TCV96751.1 DeoR family transcriptional regulator [Biostraticola tofi]
MLASQRKQLILGILAKEKQVQSTELSQRFAISEDSIRRDLRELAAEGLLQRVHGGALPVSAAIAPLAARKSVQINSKRRIAKKAVQLIQPGQVIIIDGGTTTAEMLKLLPEDLSCTVVTHSPGIAVGLIDYPAIEVILIGGKLFKHSMVTMGASMIESIARINADIFFMGVTGVHRKAGLTTGNYEEASVKRAICERAAETVVMASQEKLNSASPFVIGDLTLASTLVIEDVIDTDLADYLKSKHIAVL